jgi:hypothetical protein
MSKLEGWLGFAEPTFLVQAPFDEPALEVLGAEIINASVSKHI